MIFRQLFDSVSGTYTYLMSVRKPIIANLDVVGKFDTSQDLVHGGPAD